MLRLVGHLSGSTTGGACGNYVLRPKGRSEEPDVELTYWLMENRIKELEGSRGVVLGANGGIYSVKRECFFPFETKESVADDFILPIRVMAAGYKFVYESGAIAYGSSASYFDEFRRKARIGAQNFNGLKLMLPVLKPSAGFLSYALWSHKVLRWFTPHLLILAFIINGVLAYHFKFFYFTMVIQLALYAMAVIGSIGLVFKRKIPLLSQFGYFASANVALFVGFIKSICRAQGTKWEVSRS